MKVQINEEVCIGCGLCEELLPSVFSVGSYHAKVRRSCLLPEEEDAAAAAARDCPVNAISFRAEE